MNEILITTWAAYFIYFTQGFFFVLPGALTPVLSEYFGYSLSVVGYCFTTMTLARTLGNFFTGRIFLKLRLHSFALKSTLAIFTLLIIASFAKSLMFFTVAAVAAAAFLGTHFAISNNLILYMYVGRKRTAQISFLNFFYSAGAIASPFILSYFLGHAIHWSWIIVAVAFLVLTALLCMKSDETMFTPDVGEEPSQGLVLHKHIYLSALGSMFNVMAEMMFSAWIPVFIMERLHIPVAEAALALTMLWMGFAIGRLSCGFLANYMANYKIVFLLSVIVVTAVILLFNALNIDNYRLIILLLGMGLSGMFSNILAYGNEQTPKPNVKLMTIMTTMGSAGGLIGLFMASLMKSFTEAGVIMLSAYIVSFLSTLCVIVSVYLKSKQMRNENHV